MVWTFLCGNATGCNVYVLCSINSLWTKPAMCPHDADLKPTFWLDSNWRSSHWRLASRLFWRKMSINPPWSMTVKPAALQNYWNSWWLWPLLMSRWWGRCDSFASVGAKLFKGQCEKRNKWRTSEWPSKITGKALLFLEWVGFSMLGVWFACAN